jgi:hypothetical protein
MISPGPTRSWPPGPLASTISEHLSAADDPLRAADPGLSAPWLWASYVHIGP